MPEGFTGGAQPAAGGAGLAGAGYRPAGARTAGARTADGSRPGDGPRFSSGALKVLDAAEREARALNHGSIGSDHLLLGLVSAGDGVAAGVLGSLGVTLVSGRAEVLQLSGRGIQRPGFSRLPLAPDATRALRIAAVHARRGRPPVVAADHIMIGVLRDRASPAVRLLARLGVSPPAVRERYVQLAGLTGTAARGIRVAPGPRRDQFTDGARRALVRAEDEARLLGHRYIGTEDLLLGLLSVDGEPSAAALAWMGVSGDAVREQAVLAAGQEPQPLVPGGGIPYAADAARALGVSQRQARRGGQGQVGSEHLLLALLRDEGSLAVKILQRLGCDPVALRNRLAGR